MNQVLTIVLALGVAIGCISVGRQKPQSAISLTIDLGQVTVEAEQASSNRFVVGSTNSQFLLTSPMSPDVMVMDMTGEVTQTWRAPVPNGARVFEFINRPEGTFALYSDGVLPIGEDGTPGEYIPFNSSSYGDMRHYAIKDNKVMILARKTREQASILLFDMVERTLSVVHEIDDHSRLGYAVVAVDDGFLVAWSTEAPINGQLFDLEGSPVGAEIELWQRDEAMGYILSSQSDGEGGAVIAFMESKMGYSNPVSFTVSRDREVSLPRRYSTSSDHGSTLWLVSGGQGQIMFWGHAGEASEYTGRGARHMELVDTSEYPRYQRFVVNGPISQFSSAVCGGRLLVVGHEWLQDDSDEYIGLRRLAGVFDRTQLVEGAPVSTHIEGTEDAE